MVLFLLSLSPILTLWFLQHQVIKEAQTLDTQKVSACPISSVTSYPRCGWQALFKRLTGADQAADRC